MTRLRDLPLHKKFLRIMLISAGLALLLSWLAFGVVATALYATESVLGRAQKKLQAFRRACMALHAHAPVASPKRRVRLVRA